MLFDPQIYYGALNQLALLHIALYPSIFMVALQAVSLIEPLIM